MKLYFLMCKKSVSAAMHMHFTIAETSGGYGLALRKDWREKSFTNNNSSLKFSKFILNKAQ